MDLGVYRDGGLIVRHISPPYNAKLAHPLYQWEANPTLQFTYTPFAAVVFAAISFVPRFLDARLEEAVNLVALVAACWYTMRGLGYTSRRLKLGGALLGAAVGLLTEPVFRTAYLGQINIVLMLMIVWDLTQPDTPRTRRWKGIATGIAAGIKLIPLIFVPYLLITRKFREAFLAIAGFAGTIVVGFIVIPGDSSDFWFHGLFIQDGRTGFPGWGGDQSLHGLITRLAGSVNGGTLPWLAACLVVTVFGLLAAAALYRCGHLMLALLLASLLGLLDSPISWDHHWVWIVPGMMAAAHYAVRAWRSSARLLAAGCVATGLVLLLVFFPWPGRLWSVKTTGPGNFTWGLIWAAPNSKVVTYIEQGDKPTFSEYHWHHIQMLAGNAYVLAGLAMLVVLGAAAVGAERNRRRRRPVPGSNMPHPDAVTAPRRRLPGASAHEFLKAVPLDVLGVLEADRPQSLGGQPLVDLVEVLLDEQLFRVGGLAPVRLAGVLERGVVHAIGARRAGPGPLGRPGRDQQFAHRSLGRQFTKRVRVHHDPSRLVLTGQVEVEHGHAQRVLLNGAGLVGQRLDLDRPVAQLGVLVDNDPRERVILHDELTAQVAEPHSLLTHS
ncbi:MAG TPA: glycosyltransferase 87 family protein [Trebonia sp.]|nr:glycosyltransferase 87 family protein [Trebonia sp.]